jgi:Bacterial Ig-like domain (group 3)/FG-GAP-like repeat
MTRKPIRSRPSLRLVELEDRAVPATFTPTTTLDLDTTGVDLATGKLPTGEITLRSAILAANAIEGLDTINVPTGTYFLTIAGTEENGGATGDLDVTDDATIALNGSVVDASKLGDRVFDLFDGESFITIANGTVQGGTLFGVIGANFDNTSGGGIRNVGILTLNNVTVTGNRVIGAPPDKQGFGSAGSGLGGGVANFGNLVMNGGAILLNTATAGDSFDAFPGAGSAFGGGLYSTNGTVQLSGVRIAGNGAFGGTGNGISEGDSVGEAFGGGAYIEGFATSTITGSRIDNNQAAGGIGMNGSGGGRASGGGLYASAGIDILNSSIDSNLAQGGISIGAGEFDSAGGEANGGGITFQVFNSASIRNSTISGNRAAGGDGTQPVEATIGGDAFGGGLYVDTLSSSGAFVANVTITDNEAASGKGNNVGASDGGGIIIRTFPGGSTTSILSSIAAGNRATVNPDVSNTSFFSTPQPFASLGNNLIGISDNPAVGFTDGVNGDQVGSTSTPLDPLLTPLGFFGGSPLSLVHALNIGSPARDAGADGGLTTDQRGAGFDRAINGTADVGAFEVQIPANTTLSVPSPTIAGQTVTLTGTVTDPRFPPTGTVEFFVNGSSVGSATLDANGNATLDTTLAAPGFFTASITYSGDAAYLAASSPTGEFNAIASTTSSVAAVPSTSLVTQAVSLVSVVTSPFSGTPTGTVQFFVDGSAFGSPATLDGTGTATLVVPAGFAIGSHTVESIYSGDSAFAPSSAGPTPFLVNPSPTATSVFVFPNPVFATDPIFLSASVQGQISILPTGIVSFVIDDEIVGTAVLDGVGNAFLTLSAGLEIGDGNFDVVAVYGGDANHLGSSSVVSVLNVIPVPTRTIVSAEPNSITQGTAVTLTANVDFDLPPDMGALRAGVNPAILDGTVNFLNGTTPLGSAPITAGIATLVVTNLPVGINTITAVFVPATGNLAGSSGTTTVTVAQRSQVQEIFAASSGFGIITTVKVYDPDGVQLAEFQPYGPDYWCGAVVATGDVNGDRIEDVIVGTALSGGPHVKVYDGTTFNLIAEFFAYDPSFRGGVNVAAGDLDGDGVAEIVTGAGPGGGPQVNVYSFDPAAGLNLRNSFFAYDPDFRGGVSVAVAGGLLATGPGFTGGPHVKVFSGVDANLVASYFAFDPNSRSGVNVALSFDGTGIVLTAGTDAGRLPLVQTFDAVSGQPLETQMIYEAGFLGGVTVTNVATANGESRQVFGTGLGGGPRVRVFAPGDVSLLDFFAFGEDFRGGVFVG